MFIKRLLITTAAAALVGGLPVAVVGGITAATPNVHAVQLQADQAPGIYYHL